MPFRADPQTHEFQAPDRVIRALYVHIPFCHSICPFCAFAVHGNRKALHAPYLEALRTEMALRREMLQAQGVTLSRIQAVYLGGGTPSTLALESLQTLLRDLAEAFPWPAGVEIACEINPEDVTPDYIQALKALGITRISLGIQSLKEATLKALGRRHTARHSRQALEVVKREGPGNLSADLMSGAPGIPPKDFLEDVRALLDYHPEHVSLYGLDVEPGTLFYRRGQAAGWLEKQRETLADVYLQGTDRMKTAGYRHYEVSNLCLPGYEGRQNLKVWEGWGYLGFGPGAHSFHAGMRWSNHRHLRKYGQDLAQGKLPVAQEESPTPCQRANETLMLALRREEGLAVRAWCEAHGQNWGPRRERLVQALEQQGHAERTPTGFRLTARGFLLADSITESLMVEAGK
ncbi:MAG: radical SAM family heme chaperone HemW [Deltaproteobacteria bacterium]|nr:radical SAM family heme chaperone HemW [Deltaproteobacteria bacterium]